MTDDEKPAALGRWTPPPESVTWRSGWSVDPERAARGYAIALVLLAAGVAALTAWLVAQQTMLLPPTVADAARVQRHAASVLSTIGAAFVALMTLGTTKRCFGFGPGTWVGLGLAAVLAVGVTTFGEPTRVWLPALAIGLGVGLAGSWLAGSWAGVEERRRFAAAFAWLALVLFVVDDVREELGRVRLDADTLHRLVAHGGLAVGAALGGALGLAASRRSR